jgi:hypothetical protein
MENIRYHIFHRLTKNKVNKMYLSIYNNISQDLLNDVNNSVFVPVKGQTTQLDMNGRNLEKKIGLIYIDPLQKRSMFFGIGELII